MIISFTGAQSTGKSTLLEQCKKEFSTDSFEFYPEITRQLKHQFKLDINELGNDITQSLIMSKHIENSILAKQSSKHTIMDRCVLDGLVYTTWLFMNDKINECIFDYANNVFSNLIKSVDVIFYTDPKDIPLVDDGERSTNVVFRDQIIELFNSYIHNYSNVVTLSGNVEQRMKIIRDTLISKGITI